MSAPGPNVSELEAFAQDLAEADLQPLWTQAGLLMPFPQLLSPHLWAWKRLKALAETSGRLVPVGGEANRRVLSLSHPDLGGLPYATHTLWAGIQYLNAGESAAAHRHSVAALRFVLEGSGVWTLVNGDPVHMEPGDLVLTPSWSWHEHHNPGTEPMIWLDGTDVPLVRNLNAVFFEDGPEKLSPFEPVARSVSELYFRGSALTPLGQRPSVLGEPISGHSPLRAYRRKETDSALSDILTATGGSSAAVRYVDPLTGRDALPTMRTEMHRLVPGHRTPSARSVGSSVFQVYQGAGSSVIAGTRYSWTHGDIFVVPSWAAVDHEAAEPSDLFVLTDGPIIEALGLNREEVLPEHQEVVEISGQ